MATFGYSPLSSSIVTSSVWALPHASLRVWIYMLSQKDREDRVIGSAPTVAHQCYMTLDEFEHAIRPLLEPDLNSGSPEHEGRRLLPIQGGWFVVNGEFWRKRFSEERAKERKRRWIARKREEAKSGSGRRHREIERMNGVGAAQSLLAAQELEFDRQVRNGHEESWENARPVNSAGI